MFQSPKIEGSLPCDGLLQHKGRPVEGQGFYSDTIGHFLILTVDRKLTDCSRLKVMLLEVNILSEASILVILNSGSWIQGKSKQHKFNSD